MNEFENTLSNTFIIIFAALTMAYGWGYRGTVGHEGGAMVPGAMLGMALCLASGRLDWIKRTAVAALFGAVGWAWGGSLSYMEQTLYVLSDSFPDVLYGYSVLFLIGALWAGIGGAVLGLALTEKRSELQRLVRVFAAVCTVFVLVYLYFFFHPALRDSCELFTVEHFHDGDWLSALIILLVSALYWLARPNDRPAAALFFWSAVAWWIGYLGLTKFGGLRLGPPFRSESWGGVIGILVALLIYLARRKNRAALMMSLYGLVGGGLAFALAVFIRHPVRINWGPFAAWGGKAQWPLAEETFGFFMGLSIALAAVRLLRDGLKAPEEDEASRPLDVFSVFFVLVALMWLNLRRGPMRWMRAFEGVTVQPMLGLAPWMWYTLGGALLTLVAVYILVLYHRDELILAPPTAQGKAMLLYLLLLWIPAVGALAHLRPDPYSAKMLVVASFWLFASMLSMMILNKTPALRAASVPAGSTAPPSDVRWKVGRRYRIVWALAPLFFLSITGFTLSMQDGPFGRYRKRFGPEAYWRQVRNLTGTWRAVYRTKDLDDNEKTTQELPVKQVEFRRDGAVILTMAEGERIEDAHSWGLVNPYMRLYWNRRAPNAGARIMLTLRFREQRLYVPWPPSNPGKGYLVFEK